MTLCDWLLMLAYCASPGRFCDPLWTEEILAQTIASFREKNPTTSGGYITSIVNTSRTEFPDCQIRNYDATVNFRDPKDGHMHGAAVAGEADYLVTQNVRDFAPARDEELPYEVYAPDDFFMLIWDSQPQIVQNVFRQMEHYRAKKGRPFTLLNYSKMRERRNFHG